MIPRECDNDECDYETYVDGHGTGQARWIHVEGCDGPPPPVDMVKLRQLAKARPGSFLAFMLKENE